MMKYGTEPYKMSLSRNENKKNKRASRSKERQVARKFIRAQKRSSLDQLI